MVQSDFFILKEPVFACGFYLSSSMRELRLPSGKTIVLTLSEGRIVALLLMHPQRVLSRKYLTAHALGTRFLKKDRAIDVHVSRIRKKFGKYETSVTSCYGRGYTLTPPFCKAQLGL